MGSFRSSKKKLLIGLVLLVLLAGGAVAYAVMNLGAIAERYKPELERMAGEALGSTVTFGAISASVFPSTRLVVDEVTLESEGETLTLANLTLKVALWPLFRRRLHIQRLLVDRPDITVYLEEDGVFIAGLPRETSDEAGAAPATAETQEAPSSSGEIPVDVSLDEFALRNATITIKDAIADAEYVIADLNFTASLGLEGNEARLSNLDGGATILGDVELEFRGRGITYTLAGGAVAIEEMQAEALGAAFTLSGGLDPADAAQAVHLTADGVDLGNLGAIYDVFAPGLNDLALEGSATLDISLAWNADGGYVASGTVDVSKGQATVAEITLADIRGQIAIEADETAMGFSTADTQAMLGESAVAIVLASSVDSMNAGLERLTVSGFDGEAELKTRILLEGDMPFESDLNVTNMQFGPLVAAILPETPMSITGTLETVRGRIEGTFNEDLMPSIEGEVRAALVDGIVREVNLGREVLGKVTEIPFVGGALLDAVPESLRNFLVQDHTVLESVSGSFDMANETLTTEDLRVVSDFFTLEAKGTIGFDTDLDLDSTIYFTPEFSAGMVSTTKPLEALLDSNGRLAFPVRVSGIAPNLKVVPDVSQLLEKIVTGTVKRKAGEILEDILGGQDKPGDATGGLLDRLGIRRKKN